MRSKESKYTTPSHRTSVHVWYIGTCRKDMADAVLKRAFAIKQSRSLQQSVRLDVQFLTPSVLLCSFVLFGFQASSILRSRFAELESFCSNQRQLVSLELVKRTNELAVINVIYADSGYVLLVTNIHSWSHSHTASRSIEMNSWVLVWEVG